MSTKTGFDLLNDPIAGTNLIEASAGTGKTYTITGLFLRLVVEKRLPVGKILVVTFTEAATQELQDRVRSILRRALQAFSGEKTADVFLAGMAKKHRGSPTALRDLEEALRAFDQAAIFTIHGFCRRMLHENAFESGGLFDTALISDQREITEEIVSDYWRQHFYNASPLFVHYALNQNVSLDNLISLLGHRVALPYLKVIPWVDSPDTSVEERDFLNWFGAARDLWTMARGEIEDILSNDEGLNRVRFKKTNICKWVKRMDDCLATEGRNPVLFAEFEKFTRTALTRGVKKGCRPPAHRFFDLCDTLMEKQKALMAVFGKRFLGLKASLFGYARKELLERKAERNLQSFDDLLFRLHEALGKNGGDALARAIRSKFNAALIDEFQDTDPVQYEIFERVFGTENNILFLIGDPKQAIYGFRSADIFTYMKAAKDVVFRHTLDHNWRSAPGLITAVNAMFSGAHHPFIYDKIPFQRAIAARTKDSEILEIDGKAQPPFQLWFAHAQHVTGKDKPIAKTQARALIASAVGGEISRLLRLGKDNRATLGSRPISPEDIAVLVRRNADARLMKHVLSQRNIPSVLYSTGNLFDTHEALEVERLLASIVEPSNEGLLKTALATDMMGAKGEDLEELMKDETRWEDRVIRHKAYHDLWRKKGFVQMFRRLLFDQNVIARLMALPDGERRATNVLHLSEVLHQASVQRKPGMAGLEKWLAEQRDPNAPRLEEHQLRLESDERSVKLVTIHKAKGLEYPVVFCPFAWDGSKIKNKKEPFTFHHKVDNMQLTLDMGSENMDRHRGWAEKEALAEQLRVLYVALTRARNRCYMIWGRFNEAETSAPAYLFHQPASCRPGDAARATAERFVGLSDEDMLEDLGALTSGARGTISVSAMPTGTNDGFTPSAAKRKVLGCRTFSGHIDRSWRITSFSSLTSRGYHNADLADRDSDIVATTDGQRLDVEPVADAVLWDIFAFPKGTKAGTFVHSIFENLDFAAADPSHVENLVAEKLSEYGYESKWQGVVCRMIRNVLAVPLDSGQGQFNLSSVTRKDRLTELAFYFPLRPTSAEALKRLLAARTTIDPEADRPERMGPLDFSPVKGFMKGYMDTVFRLDNRYYLVDWKTNFLGSQVEDYGPKALAAAMSKGFYVLQYLLYTVALHQYLRLRLPGYSYEKHFGGLYYLFVRGMDPDKGSHFGVFRDRPSEVLIDDLAEALIGVG